MKKHSVVKISGELELEALQLLRDVPGVAVDALGSGSGPDLVTVDVHGVTATVEVKARRRVNAADARQLTAWASTRSWPTLLVAREITVDARDILADAGISFVDVAGAMHAELPGLYVERAALRDVSKPSGTSIRLAGKAGRVAHAILLSPQRAWTVADLAEESKASTGLTHRVLKRLEEASLVGSTGTGPNKVRTLADPSGLLDLWAEEMTDKHVTSLRGYVLARRLQEWSSQASSLWSSGGIAHAMTGPIAAERLAPFATSVPVAEVWLTELANLESAAAAADVQEVADGHNVVIRQAADDSPLRGRQFVEDVWLVDTFRLYFDLRNNPRRGREQADYLRREVIGF